MRYILGRPASTTETHEKWEQRLTRQSSSSRGLGYRLRRTAWGRGLATEGARAMVAQAFADPLVERVFASTMAVNASDGPDPIPGTEHGDVDHELTKAEWSSGPAGEQLAVSSSRRPCQPEDSPSHVEGSGES